MDTCETVTDNKKGGGNFWFLSPFLFAFMDYILHMSFHIRKQGSTLNMPIAAIEWAKLFCGHWVRHCFDLSVFIYKTFFSKSQASQAGFEPAADRLEGGCSIPLSY